MMGVKQLEALVVWDQVLPLDQTEGVLWRAGNGVTETGEKKGEKSPRGNLPHCGKPNITINLCCFSIQLEINFIATTG